MIRRQEEVENSQWILELSAVLISRLGRAEKRGQVVCRWPVAPYASVLGAWSVAALEVGGSSTKHQAPSPQPPPTPASVPAGISWGRRGFCGSCISTTLTSNLSYVAAGQRDELRANLGQTTEESVRSRRDCHCRRPRCAVLSARCSCAFPHTWKFRYPGGGAPKTSSPGFPWLVKPGLADGRFRFLMSVTLTTSAQRKPTPLPRTALLRSVFPTTALYSKFRARRFVSNWTMLQPLQSVPFFPSHPSANCFFSFFSLGPSLAAASGSVRHSVAVGR